MGGQKYTCPCCGYKTLEEQPPGTFAICPICYWEDDNVQWDNPDSAGGANPVSLRQAQQNFLTFGACASEFIGHVRKPSVCDTRDSAWQPLPDRC